MASTAIGSNEEAYNNEVHGITYLIHYSLRAYLRTQPDILCMLLYILQQKVSWLARWWYNKEHVHFTLIVSQVSLQHYTEA